MPFPGEIALIIGLVIAATFIFAMVGGAKSSRGRSFDPRRARAGVPRGSRAHQRHMQRRRIR